VAEQREAGGIVFGANAGIFTVKTQKTNFLK